MGLIMDYLTGGKKYQRTDDDYSSHSSRRDDDYSSRSSRPKKKVMYTAYCRKCGAHLEPSERTGTQYHAIQYLQGKNFGCGKNNHFPEIQEVE